MAYRFKARGAASGDWVFIAAAIVSYDLYAPRPAGADYRELIGRKIEPHLADNPPRWVYRTYGVATTRNDTAAPQKGSLLTGTGHTYDAVCQSVVIDEKVYPKRFYFMAYWSAPMTKLESETA
jgi:hypothetical protein